MLYLAEILPFCSSSVGPHSLLPACLSFEYSLTWKTHPRLVNHHLTPPTLHYYSSKTRTPPASDLVESLTEVSMATHTGPEHLYNNTSVLIFCYHGGLCWLEKPATTFLYGTLFSVVSHLEELMIDIAKGIITRNYSSWHLPKAKSVSIAQITHYLHCAWT